MTVGAITALIILALSLVSDFRWVVEDGHGGETSVAVSGGSLRIRDFFEWREEKCAPAPTSFFHHSMFGLLTPQSVNLLGFRVWFEEVGDRSAANVQRIVLEEEIPHVRFAITWFRSEVGDCSFDSWRRHVVSPLTPTMLKGKSVNEDARVRAGFDREFVRRLRNW